MYSSLFDELLIYFRDGPERRYRPPLIYLPSFSSPPFYLDHQERGNEKERGRGEEIVKIAAPREVKEEPFSSASGRAPALSSPSLSSSSGGEAEEKKTMVMRRSTETTCVEASFSPPPISTSSTLGEMISPSAGSSSPTFPFCSLSSSSPSSNNNNNNNNNNTNTIGCDLMNDSLGSRRSTILHLRRTFKPSHCDGETQAFLAQATSTKGKEWKWILSRVLYSSLSFTFLHGILNIGSMFVVSSEQLRMLLQEEESNHSTKTTTKEKRGGGKEEKGGEGEERRPKKHPLPPPSHVDEMKNLRSVVEERKGKGEGGGESGDKGGLLQNGEDHSSFLSSSSSRILPFSHSSAYPNIECQRTGREEGGTIGRYIVDSLAYKRANDPTLSPPSPPKRRRWWWENNSSARNTTPLLPRSKKDENSNKEHEQEEEEEEVAADPSRIFSCSGAGGRCLPSSSSSSSFFFSSCLNPSQPAPPTPSPPPKQFSSILDIGAGDGNVTCKLLPFCHYQASRIYVTEVCRSMRYRLRRRGFTVLNAQDPFIRYPFPPSSGAAAAAAGLHSSPGTTTTSASTTTPSRRYFDLISCFNVLDRTERPQTLLREIHHSLAPGGLFLLAVVLPWCPFVEVGSRQKRPTEMLAMRSGECCAGASFEASLVALVHQVLQPMGYEVIRWTRVPYLCEGNFKVQYSVLSDAVLVLKRKE